MLRRSAVVLVPATIAAIACACILVSVSAQPKAGDEAMILDTSFEDGLGPWREQGQAEFATDAAQAHSGKQSARITVPPGVELQYQQLAYIWGPVAHGDEFHVSLWVRAEGVADGSGAYAALQFGIEHSRLSMANGMGGWEQLTIDGKAPQGTAKARVDLILHAHGTAWFDDVQIAQTGKLEPWPDLGDAQREITVNTEEVVLPDFCGVGFHVFDHTFATTPELVNTVIAKRWREIRPSFARMNDSWQWDREMLDKVADYILRLKGTGTEVYVTTWNPKQTQPGDERRAYAKQVVGNLEYLVRERGCYNIRWYCMTNELTLGEWGSLAGDMPTFKDYHQCLYDELKARSLNIGLLSSDGAPLSYWHTIEWAAQNMDDITAIYGGHHYLNDWPLTDERFYPWFLEKCRWGRGIAKAKGKQFILGEFGCKQDGRTVDGVKLDRCVYFDTPDEPLVGIQLCEAAIAAINAGVYAMGNWTYADFPDEYNAHYVNKWGMFKWSGSDFGTRPHYYAYGLMTKYFRGPASVFGVECNDPYLRLCALQNNVTEAYSVAVINRYPKDVPFALSVHGRSPDLRLRKYVYDPKSPPVNAFGDLQPPTAVVEMRRGKLADSVAAGTLTVYTSAYHDSPPSPVENLRAERNAEGQTVVKWNAPPEPDIAYYRVYAGETQIISTVATEYVDRETREDGKYRVVAVDDSGNAGEAG
jgi:hypothetical protein